MDTQDALASLIALIDAGAGLPELLDALTRYGASDVLLVAAYELRVSDPRALTALIALERAARHTRGGRLNLSRGHRVRPRVRW